jgi:hypothetical protein
MVEGSALDWFQLIGLAALVGAGGQSARVIVGIKKLNDAASLESNAGADTGSLVIASKLFISLLIGAIAGTLAAVATMDPGAKFTAQQLAGLAAAGYAGADFIEGFMQRALPAHGGPAGQEAIGVGAAAPTATAAAGAADGAVG